MHLEYLLHKRRDIFWKRGNGGESGIRNRGKGNEEIRKKENEETRKK